MKKHIRQLKAMGACTEGLHFVNGFNTWKEAWPNIKRSDWLFWAAAKVAGPVGSAGHRKLYGCFADMFTPILELLKAPRLRAAFTEVASRIRRYSESEADGTSADAEMNFIRNASRADRADLADFADLASLADRAARASLADRADLADFADLADREWPQEMDRADVRMCEIIRKHYPVAPELGGA